MSSSVEVTDSEELLRVVAVDDHEAIRRYVANWVEKTEIASVVEVCQDAHSALEACRELHPDLVLCDIHMPYIDGHGFIEMLEQAGLDIPVLLFSAHALDPFTNRAVLQKNASIPELQSAILHCISSQNRTADVSGPNDGA